MLFSLTLIFLSGIILGSIFNRLKLPQLVGMLLTGIILGPYFLNLLDPKILSISSDLRQIALIIILTRAGLNLDINDLKKVGRPAVLMCFVPATFEILGMIIFAPKFLGLGLLAVAYYIALTVEKPVAAIFNFFIAVLMVVLATYLLFNAGTITLLQFLKKQKRYYYKIQN